MIKRIHISGYKSLKDVELKLQPLTVIMGPNASGKSNLLDALSLLSSMATRPSIKAAFDDHRGIPVEAFCAEEEGVEGILRKAAVQLTIEVDVSLSAAAISQTEKTIREMREGLKSAETGDRLKETQRVTERDLRYSVTIEYRPDSGVLRVLNERLVALNRDGSERQSRKAFFEQVHGHIALRMEGQAHPTYHEIGLPYTLISQALYAPHYPHITALKEELSRWKFFYFDPIIMRADTPVSEVTSIGPHGEDLAGFFNTLKVNHPDQFADISKTVREVIPLITSIDLVRTPHGLVELYVRENEALYSSRVISEGTLRVLGLLAILASGSAATTVGFEEPENGVHPRRLAIIARLLSQASSDSRRQIIVTTHSPRLPEYFEAKNLVIAARSGYKSVFTPFESLGPLFRPGEIDTALEERIVRGDLGG